MLQIDCNFLYLNTKKRKPITMNNSNINAFFNEIILDKFILNFVPGLILFYAVISFLGLSFDSGLAAFVIFISVSWVLGILLELVFFRKSYRIRREGKPQTVNESLNLLYGKIGMSILIMSVSMINIPAIQLYLELFVDRGVGTEIYFIVFKYLSIILVGLFLYLYYLKSKVKH